MGQGSPVTKTKTKSDSIPVNQPLSMRPQARKLMPGFMPLPKPDFIVSYEQVNQARGLQGLQPSAGQGLQASAGQGLQAGAAGMRPRQEGPAPTPVPAPTGHDKKLLAFGSVRL